MVIVRFLLIPKAGISYDLSFMTSMYRIVLNNSLGEE